MRASAELRDISIFSEDSIVYGEMSHRSKWYAVCALFTLATMTQANLYTLPNLYAVNTSEGKEYSIRKDLSISETEFGLLVSYLGIAPRVLAMLFTGRAATYIVNHFKHGNKAMLSATSGAVQLAGLSMYMTADSFTSLAPAVGLLNLGVGLNTPMNSIIIGDIFAPNDRALPVALIITADYLGAGIAALSQPLAVAIGWREAILAYACFTFIAFVFAFTLAYILRSESIRKYESSSQVGSLSAPLVEVEEVEEGEEEGGEGGGGGEGALEEVANPICSEDDVSLTTADKLIHSTSNIEQEEEEGIEGSEELIGTSFVGNSYEQVDESSYRFEIKKRWGAFLLIMSSPQLKLVYLGGGMRYGAGMAIASYTPQFFAQTYPKLGRTEYPLHATISVATMGSLAQFISAKLAPRLPGLTVPVLACLGGFMASSAIYLSTDFNFAIFMLYMTWLLGEGWFVGVVTTIQKTLPAGIARDTGLGFFFASSVLIGAADVFWISQEGIDEDDDTADDVDDDIENDDGAEVSGGIWEWLLHGKSHAQSRRAMLTGVSVSYLAAAMVFAIASISPKLWPCIKGSRTRQTRNTAP